MLTLTHRLSLALRCLYTQAISCTSCMELNTEKFDARRAAERTRSRSRRNAETPEQAAARRAADRSRSQWRRSESAEHADAQRAAERTRSRRRRNAETSAQTAARLAAELGRLQRRRQVLKSFEEALIDIDSPTDITRLCETFTLHSCGTITEKCQRCQAVFFSTERLSNSSCNSPKFSLCCGDGKVGLWSVPQPPEPLANLLTGNATHCRQFRRVIFANITVHYA